MALCTSAARLYKHSHYLYSILVHHVLSLSLSLSLSLYDVEHRTERRGETQKAPRALLTLESLFLSAAAELLREKSLVRLRLLAEFLERLELFNVGGRSGTATSIKYFTSNNGRHWNTISDQYFNTNGIFSASI